MTEDLRLALMQDNPTVGDVAGNLALSKGLVTAHRDADLVVFTECFLTDYSLEDLVRRPGFRTLVRAAIEDFSRFVRDIANSSGGSGPAVILGAPVDGLDLPFNGRACGDRWL